MENLVNRKTSFILRGAYKSFFEDLSGTQSKALILALFAYVEAGEIPDFNQDHTLDIVFKFIKTQLDRDLAAWEISKIKRSKAGKQGADIRWGSPLS